MVQLNRTETNITADFHKVDVHVVASIVKSFLKELPEPLIPYEIYENLANIKSIVFSFYISNLQDRDDDPDRLIGHIIWICKAMPIASRALIVRLLKLLNYIASYSQINQMTSEKLSEVFAPILFRSKSENLAHVRKDSKVLPEIGMDEYFLPADYCSTINDRRI